MPFFRGKLPRTLMLRLLLLRKLWLVPRRCCRTWKPGDSRPSLPQLLPLLLQFPKKALCWLVSCLSIFFVIQIAYFFDYVWTLKFFSSIFPPLLLCLIWQLAFQVHTLGAKIRLKIFLRYIFLLIKIEKSSAHFTVHRFSHCYFLWLMNYMVYSNKTTI